MAVVGLTAAKARWLRIERIVTLLFFVFVGVGIVVNLASLIREMVHGSAGIDGLQLLSSSIAVWVANVLVFSILHWQIDRGGPEARVNKGEKKPDWLFPQEGAPAEDVPAGWWPTFVESIPGIYHVDGVFPYRYFAGDVSRQDTDDAPIHDLASNKSS